MNDSTTLTADLLTPLTPAAALSSAVQSELQLSADLLSKLVSTEMLNAWREKAAMFEQAYPRDWYD